MSFKKCMLQHVWITVHPFLTFWVDLKIKKQSLLLTMNLESESDTPSASVLITSHLQKARTSIGADHGSGNRHGCLPLHSKVLPPMDVTLPSMDVPPGFARKQWSLWPLWPNLSFVQCRFLRWSFCFSLFSGFMGCTTKTIVDFVVPNQESNIDALVDKEYGHIIEPMYWSTVTGWLEAQSSPLSKEALHEVRGAQNQMRNEFARAWTFHITVQQCGNEGT